MAYIRTFFFTVVLTSLIAISYQLKCYECSEGDTKRVKAEPWINRNLNSPCGDFTESLLVTCPSSNKVCVKVVAEYSGETGYAHGCGISEKYCSNLDGTMSHGASISCYSCDTDKCNGASGVVAVTSLLVISLIAAIFH